MRTGWLIVAAVVGILMVASLIYLSSHADPTVVLPLLAIGGLIMLVLVLAMMAMIFSLLNLTDRSQAMGLPEGSIRAVIALSLIVLFAILAVYLYEGSKGSPNLIANMSDSDRVEFIKTHRDFSAEAIAAKDKDGKPIYNTDGTQKNFYNVSYRGETNTTTTDFGKQLLVLLGTLMTAITSFYLGAGTATSAAAAVKPRPSLSGINPTACSIAKNGPVIKLQVMGKNLNDIIHVTIVREGVQIVGSKVTSNPTSADCDLDIRSAAPGAWDVVVGDGVSKPETLQGALTISA